MATENKMPKVYTEEGTLVAKNKPNTETPLTQEDAEKDCAKRNAQAKELGIRTRYVVK